MWWSNPRLADVTFGGKCTYKDKDWEDREGNHEFLMYVENQRDPGGGADYTWIEVHDKDGNVIAVMSEGRDAARRAGYCNRWLDTPSEEHDFEIARTERALVEPSQAIEAVLNLAEEADLRRRFNRTAWLKSRTGIPYEAWLELQRGAEEPETERVELKVQALKEWVVRGR